MNQRYGMPPRRRPPTKGEIAARLARMIFSFLYLGLTVFFLELILRFSIYYDSPLTMRKFLIILGFSLSAGLLISAVAFLCERKVNCAIHIVTLSLLTVLFWVQYGYFHFFGAFFRWSTVAMATDVTDFYREAFQMIRGNWFSFVLIALPLVWYIAVIRHWTPRKAPDWDVRGVLSGMMGGVAVLTFLLVMIGVRSGTGDTGDSYYYDYLTPVESVDRFGLLTETRQDFRELFFGAREEQVDHGDLTETVVNPFNTVPVVTDPTVTDPVGTDPVVTEPIVIEYGNNVLDIDWDALIAGESNSTIKDMHKYFSILTPTKQNQYTGLFKGKNVIMMTLEGFSGRVLELAPDLFPTLSKMANGGFVFENYYHGVWGGSTASGEYANMTGLFYKDANCLKNTAKNDMPFTLGNLLNKQGYNSLAFHNWRAEYYSRNLSHTNYGYSYFAYDPNEVLKASNRLDFSSYVTGSKGYDWPMSDDVMAEITIPYFIDKQPFNVYYMTVSGHATYSWGGNAMSRKHRSEVAGLPYSETVKAFIAANLEVEDMVTRLWNTLDDAGILEDTVFVMACDHYPYGLTYNAETDKYDYSYTQYLAECYGISEEGIMNNPELYKNTLFLYCSSMEKPVKVSTPCCAIDIMPTLANLMGIEYDSRLYIGTDVLSNPDNVAIINCDGTGSAWNWINRYGYYNSKTGVFTPAEGIGVDGSLLSSYVNQINTQIKAKKKYSYLILEKDYYKYLQAYLQ